MANFRTHITVAAAGGTQCGCGASSTPLLRCRTGHISKYTDMPLPRLRDPYINYRNRHLLHVMRVTLALTITFVFIDILDVIEVEPAVLDAEEVRLLRATPLDG